MKKTKFWLVQIAMLAIVTLAFGSPVFATPPDHAKAGKAITSTVTADEDEMTHGEEMRLENANLDEGKASWKTSEPVPVCSPENLELCNPDTCVPPIGVWFNTCMFF